MIRGISRFLFWQKRYRNGHRRRVLRCHPFGHTHKSCWVMRKPPIEDHDGHFTLPRFEPAQKLPRSFPCRGAFFPDLLGQCLRFRIFGRNPRLRGGLIRGYLFRKQRCGCLLILQRLGGCGNAAVRNGPHAILSPPCHPDLVPVGHIFQTHRRSG